MRFLTQKEVDAAFAEGEGAKLIQMAYGYNQLKQAGLDMTVNQFRAIHALVPHADERGEVSILADDVEKPEDKVTK